MTDETQVSKKRGFYITANDKFTDYSIALLESIRATDPDTPVILIPYDDNYQQVASVLGDRFGVTVYEDLDFIQRLSERLQSTFGETFFARPNQFRKQACWFGPFDEFMYIDTDIVVFEKIIDWLDAFESVDFLCCDYQHAGGIRNVFSPQIISEGVFSEDDLKGMFNCGLWASKKGLISEEILYDTFQECAQHPEYFDFTQKTSDQPIINYMILKRMPRRLNLVQQADKAPGSWAGSSHFRYQGDRLMDPAVNKPLQYLHWAGIRIEPGCPYWETWVNYRYRTDPRPASFPTPKPLQSRSWLRRTASAAKRWLQGASR